MRSIRPSTLGIAVAAVVLGGYANLPAQEAPTAKKTKRTCIKKGEINAMSPMDERHIFVRVSATRYHLLTTDETCRGLKFARTLAIADGARRICDDGSSLITFSEPSVGTMRCRVTRLDGVESKAAAWTLIESRSSPESPE
jgi:hypothetical protein